MGHSTLVRLTIFITSIVMGMRCLSIAGNEQQKVDANCIKAHAWYCPFPLDGNSDGTGLSYEDWIDGIQILDGFPEPEKIRPLLKMSRDIQLTNIQHACNGLAGGIQELRHLYRQNFETDAVTSESDDDVTVTRVKFNGVDVKLYEPRERPSGTRPGLIYYHGGGWTTGSADSTDFITRTLAKKANLLVASVNYRLSPEYVFPLPLQDCVTAAKYFLANAANFSVDPTRIAVGGDGSGGNLAAAVALKLRDENWSPALKMQMLFYPALQAFDFNTYSYVENACDAWLTRDTMISFWLWYAYGTVTSFNTTQFALNEHTTAESKAAYAKYLPHSYSATHSSRPEKESRELWAEIGDLLTLSYFSPLMAPDVGRLPMTYIVTCEQDVLREDGFMYAKRAREAGVRVAHAHYKALHGFLNMPLDYAHRALDDAARYIYWNLR